MPPSFSVVIPVLNEEDQIENILDACTSILRRDFSDWEVIVVDNASVDATEDRARRYVDDQHVRYLRNDSNRGKGYSIRRGMLEARGELRLMCDADCSPSLRSLPRLVASLEQADVALGSRVVSGAKVSSQQALRRRFVGLGFLTLTRVLMGRLARDVYCGFKLWRADAAEAVFDRLTVEGWAFDAEAIALARQLGFRVKEVGIEWSNRPSSRLSIPDVLWPAVKELLASRRSLKSNLGKHRRVATRTTGSG